MRLRRLRETSEEGPSVIALGVPRLRRAIGSLQASASAGVSGSLAVQVLIVLGQMEQHRRPTTLISGESSGVNDTDDRATEPRRTRFENVHKWAATLAAVAAVVALVFSLYNFSELQQKPRIDETLPHLSRIGPVGNGTTFQIQPTVSTRFKTQDVEVIRDAHLQLTPVGSISSSKKPIFYWHETGAYDYDFASDQVNYRWTSDPAPFIVSQDKPQQPTLVFWADNWNLQPGQYEGSLQLSRSENHTPLTKKFCLIVSKKAADEIHGAEQRQIYFFRDDLPKFHSSSKSPACYRRETD